MTLTKKISKKKTCLLVLYKMTTTKQITNKTNKQTNKTTIMIDNNTNNSNKKKRSNNNIITRIRLCITSSSSSIAIVIVVLLLLFVIILFVLLSSLRTTTTTKEETNGLTNTTTTTAFPIELVSDPLELQQQQQHIEEEEEEEQQQDQAADIDNDNQLKETTKTVTIIKTIGSKNTNNNKHDSTNIHNNNINEQEQYDFIHNTCTIKQPPITTKRNIDNNNTINIKPIWMPGYAGSGYWIIEKIIPLITYNTYTAQPVYIQKTCNTYLVNNNKDNDHQLPKQSIPLLCITHYPFISRNDPLSTEWYDIQNYISNNNSTIDVSSSINSNSNRYSNEPKPNLKSKSKKQHQQKLSQLQSQSQSQSQSLLLPSDDNYQLYNNNIIIVIRNPAHAISSYFTRWYNSQQHIYRSHIQPSSYEEWKKWRDSSNKLTIHLHHWKNIIHTWYYGIYNTSTYSSRNSSSVIGMYIPYELLINPQSGPELIQSLTHYLADTTNITTILDSLDSTNSETSNTIFNCIYNNIITTIPKQYNYSYTIEQQELFLNTLQELQETYKNKNDTVLIKLLKYYYNDIKNNLFIEE